MELGISNIAWKSEDDHLVYHKMRAMGFTALEIAPTRWVDNHPYEQKNVLLAKKIMQDIQAEYHFHLSSMQSILFGVTDRIFYGDKERSSLLSYLHKAISYASEIGCKNIVFGCPKNRAIVNLETQYEVGVKFFQQIAQFAAEKNVYFSIEANPAIYNTNYINTTQQAVQLIQRVNCQAFGLNLDLGTMIENKETIQDIKKYLKYINHIHISEPYLEVLQERLEHKELFRILKNSVYHKAVCIEMKLVHDVNKVLESMEYIASLVQR
ncbi:MAG: sugar phosphate isomerase/epimerase [Desulfosporosinus sp.]|nr:sugar phosphate isomerase/epimerase [Desulfosporosinus sp.]